MNKRNIQMIRASLQSIIIDLTKLQIIAKEFSKYGQIKANIDKREARKK